MRAIMSLLLSMAGRVRRGVLLAVAIGLALALPGGNPAAAAIRGLIIGIDSYVNLGPQNQLSGAVNDARDIAQALGKAGAKDIILLVNDDANKAQIGEVWAKLVARAHPGDTLVFSYAGHGSRELKPGGPDARGEKYNENFILGGFAAHGKQLKERIVGFEMNAWLKLADDKGIRTIFIADSCHSGHMYRSIGDDNGVHYRFLTIPTITDDQLKLPPPKIANATPGDFKNLTFVGATDDAHTIPEVKIGDQMRGALSYSFARAIEGGADRNHDGEITQEELVSFLVPKIFQLVQGQQNPQVLPIRTRGEALIASAPQSTQPKAVPKDADALAIRVIDGDGAALAALPDVRLTEESEKADLIWNVRTGSVEQVVGGVVAEHADADAIIPIVAKWATIKWLTNHATGAPGEFILRSGNQRYKPGEEIDVAFKGAERPYITLFNLAPNGRVEFFVEPDEVNVNWIKKTTEWKFTPEKPPFGAEHLVAIFTDKALPAFHAALQSMSSADRAVGLRGIVEAALGSEPFQFGMASIYTGKGG